MVTICNQLKMQSSDGKYYKTDVADTEQLLRLIQSIPSPKAEPFKLWIAQIKKSIFVITLVNFQYIPLRQLTTEYSAI